MMSCTARGALRPISTFIAFRPIGRTSPSTLRRALSTLPDNPHIYVHQPSQASKTLQYVYSLLPVEPTATSLALGFSPIHPPTLESFTENPDFLPLVHQVIERNAVHDPEVQAQAATYASQAGSALGTGGIFYPHRPPPQRRIRRSPKAPGSEGASGQGGMGGAGRGGYIHVSDQRNPPDFGRIAWPEDILGSLELDGHGRFVEGTGRYQTAGTYRILTHAGMFGLSPYLRGKVVERLQELDAKMR